MFTFDPHAEWSPTSTLHMLPETGDGTGVRERHVLSQEDPFHLVTALLKEGLDAPLKGQHWA